LVHWCIVTVSGIKAKVIICWTAGVKGYKWANVVDGHTELSDIHTVTLYYKEKSFKDFVFGNVTFVIYIYIYEK
jgi:hypothetical protein